jgi:hypothetical protein
MARYAERHDLSYQTRKGVLTAVHHHRLVRLDGSSTYQLHDVAYPFVRPAAKLFVERLSQQYSAACGDTLVVTSAIRPAREHPWNSVARSVHPTGIAVDLRKPVRAPCRKWLRETLLALERTEVLGATEEFFPPHFHVAVYGVPYRAYLVSLTTPATLAEAHASTDISVHAVRRRVRR